MSRAGENYGHIICLDKHTTGDGIGAALHVLAVLRRQGLTLTDACADLVMYPQQLIHVRLPAGFDWHADAGISAACDSAERALDGKARVLLRPSGTEPLLRVMVEGENGDEVERWAEGIAQAARKVVGANAGR